MRVEIKPLYPLNKRVEGGWRDFPEGSTPWEILEALGFSPPEIREMRVAVEGALVDMDRPVSEGTTLVLMATLAGG